MGRAPCCDKANVKRGPWSPEEDATLKSYVEKNGTGGNWIALPQKAGLKRCGKSCRLRWLNYLRPDIKHGGFTEEEDHIICSLYKSLGSRWSVIASQLPGRTDNDVKNYWNTKLKKKLLSARSGTKPTAAPTPPAPPPPHPTTAAHIKTETAQFSTTYNPITTQLDSTFAPFIAQDPTFNLPTLPFANPQACPSFWHGNFIPSPSTEEPQAASSSLTTDNSSGSLWMESEGLLMDMQLDASPDLLDYWSLHSWVGGFESQNSIFPCAWAGMESCNPPPGQDLHPNLSYS